MSKRPLVVWRVSLCISSAGVTSTWPFVSDLHSSAEAPGESARDPPTSIPIASRFAAAPLPQTLRRSRALAYLRREKDHEEVAAGGHHREVGEVPSGGEDGVAGMEGEARGDGGGLARRRHGGHAGGTAPRGIGQVHWLRR